MQLFNVNTEEASYISNLLKANYVPTIQIFNSEMNLGDKVSSSEDSEKSLLTPIELPTYIPPKETFILDSTLQVNRENALTQFPSISDKIRYVSPYVFGKYYPNITSNYISNKRYYDTELHEYLGRYLRAYRDYYNVDVMNFYNCFSNRFITNYSLPITFKLDSDLAGIKFSAYDSRYKVIAFPIEWDREYTIKFYDNNISNIGYQAVYFNGSEPLGYVEKSSKQDDKGEVTIISSDNDPTVFKITVPLDDSPSKTVSSSESAGAAEKARNRILSKRLHLKNLLYLFIQFPSIIEGPIAVLEQPTFTRAINNSLLNLDRNIDYQVAFSDRLLEYLTRNVTCPSDSIKQNIHLIQKVTQNLTKNGLPGVKEYSLSEHPSGTFDLDLQRAIYNYFYDKEGIYDFIGFVDKDIEKRLTSAINTVKQNESKEIIRNGVTYK